EGIPAMEEDSKPVIGLAVAEKDENVYITAFPPQEQQSLADSGIGGDRNGSKTRIVVHELPDEETGIG
ncbi:hypothetical protein KI387_010249, partial [Taxus chinensis]